MTSPKAQGRGVRVCGYFVQKLAFLCAHQGMPWRFAGLSNGIRKMVLRRMVQKEKDQHSTTLGVEMASCLREKGGASPPTFPDGTGSHFDPPKIY